MEFYSTALLAALWVPPLFATLGTNLSTAQTLPPNILIENDSIPAPLTSTAGDPTRGRAIVASRQTGLCVLCHAAPIPEERFQGDLAPSLAGVGSRLSEGQIRLRLVDSRRANPDTIMPPYYDGQALMRVASAFRGKPILSAQQIEDVVAYLSGLKE